MSRKKASEEQQQTGTEPAGPRRMMVALPAESEKLLRKVAARTGFALSALRNEIQDSKQLEDAVREILHQLYAHWVAGDDPFAIAKEA